MSTAVRAPASPSYESLKAFATETPANAKRYLTQVAERLRVQGAQAPAVAIEALLSSNSPLTELLERDRASLGLIFPEAGTHWGSLQAARAGSLGWSTEGPKPAQQIAGQISSKRLSAGAPEVLRVTTASGKQLMLGEAIANSSFKPMSRSWVQGFAGDGPVSLKGSLGNDGQTFNVEAFALNTSGLFNQFTFARVVVTDQMVSLSSPRGSIEVTAPKLRAALMQLPGLGIILPGEPNASAGRLVYDREPERVQVLARFRDPAKPSSEGRVSAPVDMALSALRAAVSDFPAEQASRSEHGGRVWLQGTFKLDQSGAILGFDADYVSKRCDSNGVDIGHNVPDADPVQAAVLLSEG